MTRAVARTAIQSTFETVAGAPTSSELNTWIDIEHKLLRRELARIAPTLYTATSSESVLTTSSVTITVPSDFDSLVRLEVKSGNDWYPVPVSDELWPHAGDLNFREDGTTIALAPSSLVPGTYRLVYISKPTTLSADSGAGGVLLVPDGLEDVIVERCAARARVKLEEDPSPHLGRAAAIWAQQKGALRKRYGRHPVPGLRTVRRW